MSVLHDFRCEQGHIFDKMVPWDHDDSICPACGARAVRVFLPRHRNAQNFDPVVIFRGPKGKVRFPGRSDAPTPQGYERVELRTSHEVHKFEREMNAKEMSKYQNRQEREERCYEPFHSAMRSQLRAHAQHFSQQGRDFAELAMRENNNRPRERFDPGFHIEAFHYNMGRRGGK